MKVIFDEYVFGEWIWLAEAYDEDGSEMSKIYTNITEVNIFNKSDWPRIISFSNKTSSVWIFSGVW